MPMPTADAPYAVRRRSPLRRLVGLTLMVVLSFVLPSWGLVLGMRWLNPSTTWLMMREPPQRDIARQWVPLDCISPHLVRAVIAAEDNKFLSHSGFDWEQIQLAWQANQSGKRLRGASTISQQTAKNLCLWPGRTWLRKGLEAYFTMLIEVCWSKQRIMEVYLNIIEMGPGIYGAHQAARHHFGCEPHRLSAHQAAMQAAVLPDPKRRNPKRPGDYTRRYQQTILQKMALQNVKWP